MKKILLKLSFTMCLVFPAATLAQSTTQTQPDLRVLYQAIVAEAANSVADELRARQDWYWTVATTVVSLTIAGFAVLGYGRLRDMRIELKSDLLTSEEFRKGIEDNVSARANAVIKDQVEAIRRQFDFLSLQIAAEKVRQGQSFTNTERDALYNGLVRLKDDEAIVKDPQFAVALEAVVESFYQAGIYHMLDDLESKMTDIFRSKSTIIATMMHMYAQRVLGEVEREKNAENLFFEYAKCCRNHRLTYISFPYLVVLRHADQSDDRQSKQRKIEEYLRDITYLDDNARDAAIQYLNRFCDPKTFSDNPKAEHLRISKKFSDFVTEYEQRLAEISQNNKNDQPSPVSPSGPLPIKETAAQT